MILLASMNSLNTMVMIMIAIVIVMVMMMPENNEDDCQNDENNLED